MAIFRITATVTETQLGSIVAALKNKKVRNIDFAIISDEDEIADAPKKGRQTIAHWLKVAGPLLKKGKMSHTEIMRQTGIASSMLYAVRKKMKIKPRK